MATYSSLLLSKSSVTHTILNQPVILELTDQYRQQTRQVMEKVCSRPVSLPSLRQRILPGIDTAFRPQSVRYSNVQSRLSQMTDQFGDVHLRDVPLESSLPDMRPVTAVLKVVPSPAPRNMSTPSASFTYDGLDLTGVIRTRLLEQYPSPCHERREHSSAIVLKRHFRKMEERKSATKTRGKRTPSANLSQYAIDISLDDRKSCRESRVKPWREETPKYVKPGVVIPAHNKKAVAAARSRLLEDAWLEERDNEMWAINSKESFKPVTVVLVSSQLKFSAPNEVLTALLVADEILPVVYNYMSESHTDIIDVVRETLEYYGNGIRAERLVILCQGGPSHIFLLNKQMMTGAKIRKNNDIKQFWGEIGKLMSKRDYMKTSVILGGSAFDTTLNGLELLADIQNAMKPNKVSVSSLPLNMDLSAPEQDLISSLFVSVAAYRVTFELTDDGENS